MTILLRLTAIAIAIAAIIDPVIARNVSAPLPVDVLMPAASDPLYPEAAGLRERIAAALNERAILNGAERPQALIAIGRAPLPGTMGEVPTFSISPARPVSVSITDLRAPSAIPGQQVPVVATVQGRGMAGRTTSFHLQRDGISIASVQHRWTTDDERFVGELQFAPTDVGVHRLRVTATTPDLDADVVADTVVVARDRRLRVLAYEGRPSWPLAFVRRSLEGDPLFDVATTARTTGRLATTSPTAPASLATLQADRFDAVIVGAPEVLSATDMNVLESFVSRRGGALLLLPDRRLPENVRRRFGLPALDEVVLETPLRTAGPGPSLRASELLLGPAEYAPGRLGIVRHGERDRAVVTTTLHGAGRILLSGALDAWRYRADTEGSFDMFWRGLVADVASQAPSRLTVSVVPSVTRPGDEISVSAKLRSTEFDDNESTISIPAVRAELIGVTGPSTVRLWPGSTIGTYEATLRAPGAGAYSLSVSAVGTSADAPLLIADDVTHAVSGSGRAAAFAAVATGGAVVTNVEELIDRIARLGAAKVEKRTRPMQSPWWIVPFAGALCVEWGLRRRLGGR